MKNELYRLTDSFLVEATNEKGEHRSLERLNADRHLFVENAMELINRQIASAVEARESSYREEVLSKLRSATCYADPSRGVLLSNPPQHQCEACGRRWVVGEKTPVCDYIRKADITNLNPSKE